MFLTLHVIVFSSNRAPDLILSQRIKKIIARYFVLQFFYPLRKDQIGCGCVRSVLGFNSIFLHTVLDTYVKVSLDVRYLQEQRLQICRPRVKWLSVSFCLVDSGWWRMADR